MNAPAAEPSRERSVLVGVTGGIAAYKAVDVVRRLVKDGFATRVVMTASARRFVTPLTFAAIAQAPVIDDDVAWQAQGGWFEHIEAARDAGVMVVAPATANTLAKLAAGIADNVLTTTALAFRGPLLVAPAMNWAMYEHPATVENLRVLRERGVEIIPAEAGELACGETGAGRMAEPAAVCAAVRRALAGVADGPLAGKTIVITSGGTREAIDAVRYIGNRSSGKMGRALAAEASARGARVVLITTQPSGGELYEVVPVETAEQMAVAVRERLAAADVLVMAAAVADYRPAAAIAGKIERADSQTLTLELVRTTDILAESSISRAFRVGFAAEAGPNLERARQKRLAKRVDLLVFNDISRADVGIGADDNELTLISAEREVHVPRAPKAVCAAAILDEVAAALGGQT